MRSVRRNINKFTKHLSYKPAFTIIELIIVAVIITTLSAIVFVSYNSWRLTTAVTQLKSDLSGVASAMENYRTFNNIYPTSVSTISSTFASSSGVTLSGGSSDGGLTYCVNAVSLQFTNNYYHIDSTSGGNGAQPGVCVAAVQYTLTVNAGANGTASGGGTFNSGTTPTITATPNNYYSFNGWTGAGCGGGASTYVTMTSNITCTANFVPTNIPPPSQPTVTANTVGATTTFSWDAAYCGGNTARYQYDYTVSPSGYDSGWVATASISAAFTTSTQGSTYTINVQAQCYNAAASSSWSSSGLTSYYRPMVYTVTMVAVGSGTVSGGGSYDEGSTPTITATANALYYFAGWRYDSSTGCDGTASHAITVNANKTCYAIFYATPIATPSNPTVGVARVVNTLNYSWSSTCGANSARYQRRFTIYDPGPPPATGYSSGTDPDYIATDLTTYSHAVQGGSGDYDDLHVQIQCYNAATSSSWSAFSGGIGSYVIP
jgi:Tfp pilus assembly protein PilE